ncbi:MAG: hypothetical protein LBP19_10760, partial [Treponema sp.]|nr:hypothetical protein [Treponema sp.]
EAIVRLTAAIAQEEPPKPYTTPDVSTLNASTPDTARYFSVKEAAKYTTLSTVTIRRAAKERRLAYCHNCGIYALFRIYRLHRGIYDCGAVMECPRGCG